MRLKISANAAQELLIAKVNEGYAVLDRIWGLYRSARQVGAYEPDRDNAAYRSEVQAWSNSAIVVLVSIFPTLLEVNRFRHAEASAYGQHGVNDEFNHISNVMKARIEMLDSIRANDIGGYTDLPAKERLYVEDIDSFSKVRDVNPDQVAAHLKDGFFDRSEEQVQRFLEEVLKEPFHKEDWGGEINDLNTTVTLQGMRVATAFLLKGNGLKVKLMQPAHCGKNGDQIQRLAKSPARLLVVQYVGSISEAVTEQVATYARELSRHRSESVYYCIITGQDTARLFAAYGARWYH